MNYQINFDTTKVSQSINKVFTLDSDLGYYKSVGSGKSGEVMINKYKFTHPKKAIDLNKTFNKQKTIKYIREFDTTIDPFVDYLIEKGIKACGSIVTYRSCLRQILVTPYIKYEWSCYAYKKNNCIYLYDVYDPKYYNNVIKGIHNNNYFKNTCCNMTDDVYHVNKWNIKTKQADLNIIVSSSVDGIYHNKSVKLKTMNMSLFDNCFTQIDNKFINLWSQCFLDNADNCICGFYEHQSTLVTKVKRYSRNDLSMSFNPNVGIYFMVKVLLCLNRHLKNNKTCFVERNSTGIHLSECTTPR